MLPWGDSRFPPFTWGRGKGERDKRREVCEGRKVGTGRYRGKGGGGEEGVRRERTVEGEKKLCFFPNILRRGIEDKKGKGTRR